MTTTNGTFQILVNNKKEFLTFLKSRYSLYHLSNVFYRDLHYGLMAFLKWRNTSVSYAEGEELTNKIVAAWESEGLLKKIDRQAFLLQYPEFKKPPVKAAAPAKPAAKPSTAQPAKPASDAAKPAPKQSTAVKETEEKKPETASQAKEGPSDGTSSS